MNVQNRATIAIVSSLRKYSLCLCSFATYCYSTSNHRHPSTIISPINDHHHDPFVLVVNQITYIFKMKISTFAFALLSCVAVLGPVNADNQAQAANEALVSNTDSSLPFLSEELNTCNRDECTSDKECCSEYPWCKIKSGSDGKCQLAPPTGAPTGDTSIGSRLVNFMAKEIALANAKADEDSLEDKQEHLLVNKEDVSKNLRGAADALFPFYDEEGGGEDSEVGCKEEGAKGCGPFNKCCDGNYCMPVPFMGNYCQKKWGEEGGVLFTI
jgi:hypothetical protein